MGLRRVPSRVTALASMILVGLLLAGCSGATTALTSTTTTLSKSATSVPKSTTTTTAPPPQRTFNLYFVRGSTLGVATRTVGTVDDPHYAQMLSLVFGPTPAEVAAGLITDIPSGTVVRGLVVRNGLATVNFSPSFVEPAPPAVLSARLAQVVYTLTSFPNVTGVVIQVAKVQLVNFAGVNMSAPIGRTQVTSALPDVLLESPAVGGSLRGELSISGITAFDGTYDVDLTDPSGKLLAAVTNTAAIGGTFQQSVPFTISSPEIGTIHVFSRSLSDNQASQEYQFTVALTP